MPRTRRSDSSDPGYARIRRGKGFSYHDEDGGTISDEEVLTRIRGLVIPPAWTNVWICPDERGHIQAVGTDAAGRRQYLYHDDWRAQRDRAKFRRLPEFAATLPPARDALESDLKLKGLVRERVLACAVRLLDIGLFRVGGEDYAEENESFGLATLEKRHVSIRRGGIDFAYVAKGQIEQRQTVEDKLVAPTVLALKRRRGKPRDPLLAYRRGAGEWEDVSSVEINQWLKDLIGDQYSAKDFRTWNATVLAAMRLADRIDAADRDKAVAGAIEEVAAILGNTPAVCRASYVDPRVIRRYKQGVTIAADLERLAAKGASRDFAERAGIERAVVELIT
ncbi:MAG: DNA topoisomerase IB [Actinomycetota bacterium]|nr:DNA topoisomerase IB [Actinomycetota bacterium]